MSWLEPQDLTNILCTPSTTHWFGCDIFGRDLLARILYGILISTGLAVAITVLSLIGACLISFFVTTNTFRRRTYQYLQIFFIYILDCALAFPTLILCLIMSSVMPNSIYSFIIALVVPMTLHKTIFFDSAMTTISRKDYVASAHALGLRRHHLFYNYYIKNLWPELRLQGLSSFIAVIMAESTLSYLGLTSTLQNNSLGKLLSESKDHLFDHPHAFIFPALCIITLLVILNFLLRKKQFEP